MYAQGLDPIIQQKKKEGKTKIRLVSGPHKKLQGSPYQKTAVNGGGVRERDR